MKIKRPTCSTGHGTGVLQGVPLRKRLGFGRRVKAHTARRRMLGVTVTPWSRYELKAAKAAGKKRRIPALTREVQQPAAPPSVQKVPRGGLAALVHRVRGFLFGKGAR